MLWLRAHSVRKGWVAQAQGLPNQSLYLSEGRWGSVKIAAG